VFRVGYIKEEISIAVIDDFVVEFPAIPSTSDTNGKLAKPNITRNRDTAQVPSIANIDVINESTVIEDDAIEQYTLDLQTRLDRDYAVFWGTTAFIRKAEKANHDHWWQVLFDKVGPATACLR
jgi:hypothetical protein